MLNICGIGQAVKHPNIVRLFDVIETEKYIGIILDFANGESRIKCLVLAST